MTLDGIARRAVCVAGNVVSCNKATGRDAAAKAGTLGVYEISLFNGAENG